jgi:hypothetical protein
MIAACGIGWMVDESGVSVPWRTFPAAALMLIGAALLVTLLGGRGRRVLIPLGALTLLLAVAVGIGADRYAGPVGDTVLAPTTADWPADARVSTGTLTVDLTRYPLPESGQLRAEIGAGRLIVIIPAGSQPAIDARTTIGTVSVDGVKVSDGVDVRWSQPHRPPYDIELTLQVGLGDIEVNHA